MSGVLSSETNATAEFLKGDRLTWYRCWIQAAVEVIDGRLERVAATGRYEELPPLGSGGLRAEKRVFGLDAF